MAAIQQQTKKSLTRKNWQGVLLNLLFEKLFKSQY